ncbi:Diphthamide biosynthesis protein 4 [Metarhizium acridum CQMa 102]|uniref:Diphthamide biosynthesis protein 4 n=1 Tax=Metarhizium acridum (strain CQMa 102) TaxID=655827 RepID=E9DTR9_METAQ|nr:Diphthamide biosynthesis protein 4 [Metarhizium acridum CQMa 102]EFY92779.1 Diphthamide biosynthesis protein 4 [Metarhizium acridum CQMa 102]
MRPPHPPTHYEILNLTPSIIDDSPDAAKLIKKAYHRALLRNHPDKATTHAKTPPGALYSIDQITTAFTVLSAPRQRTEYDAKLRQAQTFSGSAGPDSGQRFQTGVENVDLDDLPSKFPVVASNGRVMQQSITGNFNASVRAAKFGPICSVY